MSHRLVFLVTILMSVAGHLDPASAAPKPGKSIGQLVDQFGSKGLRLNPETKIAVTALVDEAVENVVRNVLKPGKRVTKPELLEQEVARLATARAAADPNLSIEYLSGKFSIKRSTTIGGVEVTGGQTNVYAVLAVLAAVGVVATVDCEKMDNWVKCVIDATGRKMAPAGSTGPRGMEIEKGAQ